MNLSRFLEAYLVCALWADLHDDSGEPLDEYSLLDIAGTAHAKAQADCEAFIAEAGELLHEWTDEQAGHDFWLTRNHHGAGFWDRGKTAGRALTKIAQGFSSSTPVVGDDGKIYFE